MKRKFILCLMALVLGVGSIFGLTACTGGSGETTREYQFSYSIENDEVTFISMASGASNYFTIPSTVEGYPVTKIANNAFNGRSIISVTIPNTVKTIEAKAFENCSQLKTVTFSGTSVLESIGAEAFKSTPVEKILLPNSVVEIGNGAFEDCSSLKSVELSTGMTYLPERIFKNCTSLVYLNIPQNITTIRSEALLGTDGLRTLIVNSTSISASTVNALPENGVGAALFIYAKASVIENLKTSVAFSSHANRIYDEACIIKSDRDYAVREVDGGYELIQLIIKNDSNSQLSVPATIVDTQVVAIGENAVSDIKNTIGITISRWVKTVADGAFKNNAKLGALTFYSAVNSLGKQLFAGCTSLASLKFESTQVPSGDSIDIFEGFNDICTINVPTGSLDSYKSSWYQLANRIYGSN